MGEDLKWARDLLEKDTDSSKVPAETGSWVSQRAALSGCLFCFFPSLSPLLQPYGKGLGKVSQVNCCVTALWRHLTCTAWRGLYKPCIQISHTPAVHGLTELEQHCQIFGACLHEIPSCKSDRCFCSGSYSGQLLICLQRGCGCTSPTSCRTELRVSSYVLSLGIFPRPEYLLTLKGWCHRAISKDTKVNSLNMSWTFSSCLEFPCFSLEEIFPHKVTNYTGIPMVAMSFPSLCIAEHGLVFCSVNFELETWSDKKNVI